MRTYLLYIVRLVALMACLAVSIHARLLWPSISLGAVLLWLCASLYSRTNRLLYAYRETEKENERLHARLAEAERQLQYLRQLTENVDTALFVCSTDGRIDWMNHAAKKIAPPSAPEGTTIVSTTDSKTIEAPSGAVGGAFLPPHILQAIADHAEVVDGCALSTVLLRIDGQRRLVVALKDVSMLMQRQEMEAWQQLIRVLTHEIMNSLTPIISISETLSVQEAPKAPKAPPSAPEGATIVSTLDSETIEAPSGAVGGASSSGAVGGAFGAFEAFAVINRRCHALLDFVESYRQLTRIKTPVKTTFPINELLEHITGLYPQVKTQGTGQLTADRSQLEQVLINLVRNAYESGATEVLLSANGEGEIRVKDNGSGMSPDVIDHAFIPFFTTKPSGTGIGLSLCRQIILKHSGTIRVESQQGKGTTFIIQL